MKNFNLKNFLIENKLTTNSKELEEGIYAGDYEREAIESITGDTLKEETVDTPNDGEYEIYFSATNPARSYYVAMVDYKGKKVKAVVVLDNKKQVDEIPFEQTRDGYKKLTEGNVTK